MVPKNREARRSLCPEPEEQEAQGGGGAPGHPGSVPNRATVKAPVTAEESFQDLRT